MSRILYIDPIGGVAGDMLCAALLDAGLDEEQWRAGLRALPWDEDVEILRSTVMRGVFSATHIDIKQRSTQGMTKPTVPSPHIDAVQHHNHTHHTHTHHGHSHTHAPMPTNSIQSVSSMVSPNAGPQPVPWSQHHRGFSEIQQVIQASTLPEPVQAMAIKVFEVLGQAEAEIHGSTLEDIHFHEVGAVDSILDIVGFCLGVHLLNINSIQAGAVPLSSGQIHTAHGLTPLPAPATLRILRGWPNVKGFPNHEQVTPTGAAILQALASYSAYPAMTTEADGYGAGTRNPPNYPNLVRVAVGCTTPTPSSPNVQVSTQSVQNEQIQSQSDTVIEIQANIDDMSAELLSPLIDQLLKAGALDATLTPILMKKGRAGHLCTILTTEYNKESVLDALFTHSTTFGCRLLRKERIILQRMWDSVQTPLGEARMKIGLRGNTVCQISVEFEDARALATQHSLSLTDVIPLIQRNHHTQYPHRYDTTG